MFNSLQYGVMKVGFIIVYNTYTLICMLAIGKYIRISKYYAGARRWKYQLNLKYTSNLSFFE